MIGNPTVKSLSYASAKGCAYNFFFFDCVANLLSMTNREIRRKFDNVLKNLNLVTVFTFINLVKVRNQNNHRSRFKQFLNHCLKTKALGVKNYCIFTGAVTKKSPIPYYPIRVVVLLYAL